MKRLYDAICKNASCSQYNEVTEVFKNTDDPYPPCKKCGRGMARTYTKTPSFEINGGGVYKPGMSHSV